MVHWAGDKLKKLGAEVEYANVGMQELPNGSKIALPPVLMGSLGKDPQKKTLLVYGHLDVQPALKEDGWDYEPFVVRILLPNKERGWVNLPPSGTKWWVSHNLSYFSIASKSSQN